MITGGYTLNLICDCKACQNSTNSYEIATGEYVGQTYIECAASARKDGWTLSRDRVYCSAPKHGKAQRDE